MYDTDLQGKGIFWEFQEFFFFFFLGIFRGFFQRFFGGGKKIPDPEGEEEMEKIGKNLEKG